MQLWINILRPVNVSERRRIFRRIVSQLQLAKYMDRSYCTKKTSRKWLCFFCSNIQSISQSLFALKWKWFEIIDDGRNLEIFQYEHTNSVHYRINDAFCSLPVYALHWIWIYWQPGNDQVHNEINDVFTVTPGLLMRHEPRSRQMYKNITWTFVEYTKEGRIFREMSQQTQLNTLKIFKRNWEFG